MLWDLFQESRIHQAQSEASQANNAVRASENRLRELETHVRYLEQEMSRVQLVLMATTELLKEKVGISDEELAQRVTEIDLRDGVADGRVTKGPCNCPNCGRPNQTQRRKHCLYCGATLPVVGF